MTTLEKGQEKIEKICEVLRHETLEPAKMQAQEIVAEGRQEAEKIVEQAKAQANQLIEDAKKKIQQERSVFQSSLHQASRQGLEALRQDIEQRLFNKELATLVESGSSDPALIAKLIGSLAEAVSREGVTANLEAVIPATVNAAKVSAALAGSAVKGLEKAPQAIGNFKGGAQLKWHDKKLTIDITDEALKELMAQYVRKDFRKLLFGE